MILITGASGKTGIAILRALVAAGQNVRTLVRREAQAAESLALGASESFLGDVADSQSLAQAYAGVSTVYHICPNMNPAEVEIGKKAITAACQAGIQHFVYHSVLHPQVQEMAHHWAKLQVEALLFKSGLNTTILQPASYMENIAGYWQQMLTNGEYVVPYNTASLFSMVALDDVGQAAASVIGDGESHYRAIYELCGSQLLSSQDIAEKVSALIHRPVHAVELSRIEWERRARAGGLNDYARTTLLAMFEYYDRYGFSGNANGLTRLLGRPPGTIDSYLTRLYNNPQTD